MEFNKLYNADCLKGMRDIPDGSVDLIVCDPPYGTINGLGKNTDLRKEDGYEMNENFYKQAQKRIEHALISPTLF